MGDQFAIINNEPSDERERRQTQHLKKFLEEQKLYEDVDEALKREEVLGRLDQVVKTWVRLVARACGMAESTVQEANAKIFTFGSYRLGVHAPGADIDVLCVGPAYAKRDQHFFGQELHCLEKVLQGTPGVTEVRAVPKAYVPVLQIKFCGLELDVLYAALATFLIPEELDLSPNSVLRGINDEPTVRSLNGCRVTDTILRSVPNIPTFRLALKALKLWADRRGIYSNVAGYLGGVNMALLVAKVCRWYPKKDASAILFSLFMFFGEMWKWPTPLHLIPQRNDDHMGLACWDPVNNERDKRALMPIITPAYPAMNSAYNVSRSTLQVMLKEFKRAFDVCKDILLAQANNPNHTNWAALFEPYKFFEVKSAFYVTIAISAANDSDLEKWDGWVRSRIRLLVRGLEDHLNVRPHPDSMRDPADAQPSKYYFLSLTRRPPEPGAAQAAQPHALQRNAGATSAPGDRKNSINVTQPIQLFTKQVLEWEEKRDKMELRPSLKRQWDLPSWVFPEGYNPLNKTAANASGVKKEEGVGGPPEKKHKLEPCNQELKEEPTGCGHTEASASDVAHALVKVNSSETISGGLNVTGNPSNGSAASSRLGQLPEPIKPAKAMDVKQEPEAGNGSMKTEENQSVQPAVGVPSSAAAATADKGAAAAATVKQGQVAGVLGKRPPISNSAPPAKKPAGLVVRLNSATKS